jgi:TonB family protein
MSSMRVALASCALTMALGIGAWSAVQAFPLYTELQQETAPPRDPLSPDALHRLAVEYYDKAMKDTTLTPDEKQQAIVKGISYEDRVLERKPDHLGALTYKNILLRMQANLSEDAQEREALLKLADELRARVIVLQAVSVKPGAAGGGPAPASPEFLAAVERLQPVRVGGNIKTPIKIKDIRPAYPPEAQAARVQGVVILETLIDTDGQVVDVHIQRSIPLLDQAASDAVRQWAFTPTLLNGNPTAVLMTVTVNFTLQ